MKKKLLILTTALSFTLLSNFTFANSYIMHTVGPEDTYWNICKTYEKNIAELIALNNYPDDNLPIHSLLKIQQINTIHIFVNGEPVVTDSYSYLEKDYTHVPMRPLANAIGANKIEWDQSSLTAIVSKGDIVVKLPLYSKTAYVNNDPYPLEAPINMLNDRIYVPLRFVAEVFGYSVSWDQNNFSAYLNQQNHQTMISTMAFQPSSYSEEDIYWLSRIIEAEAQGEPYEGKLAVANVIINRKNNSEFPNTIKEVIFDGYQFTPVIIGTIYNTPSEASVKAAKDALAGKNNIGNCLYFLNPTKSTNFWIVKNKTFFTSIDNHDFYY
ncbi:MAG: cell wall hydrolase [Peptostreptococcales bacterium]